MKVKVTFLVLSLTILSGLFSNLQASEIVAKGVADDFYSKAQGKNLTCMSSEFCQDGNCPFALGSDGHSYKIRNAKLAITPYDSRHKPLPEDATKASGYKVTVYGDGASGTQAFDIDGDPSANCAISK